MTACVHMDDAQWCQYHRKADPLIVADALWRAALAEDTSLPLPAQVTATIVPVPTTARLEYVPHTKWGGHGGSLPRSEHPSLTVLVTKPPVPDEQVERLRSMLVEARPDWVRA